jgi:hypothetical protein
MKSFDVETSNVFNAITNSSASDIPLSQNEIIEIVKYNNECCSRAVAISIITTLIQCGLINNDFTKDDFINSLKSLTNST